MSETTNWQAHISDAELDRLETLLEDPAFAGSALRLDEIQGYLCAALAGSQAIEEAVWLVDILGSEAALETDAGQEAAHILRRFAHALTINPAAGEPLVLLLYPISEEDETSDYEPWCQAYLSAIDAAETDWFDFLADAKGGEECTEIGYLDEHLFPLMVLTGEAEAAAREFGETWPEGEELARLEAECQEELPQVVADIYTFWMAIRHPAEDQEV